MEVKWEDVFSVMINGVWIEIDQERGYSEQKITYVLDGDKHVAEARFFGFYSPDGTFLHGPVSAIACFQSHDRG